MKYEEKLFLPEKELVTDEEIGDYFRAYSQTLYHPVGTCKMGKDTMAVVDAST